MSNAVFLENVDLIIIVTQANNGVDFELFEDGDVVFGLEKFVLKLRN